MCAPTSSPAAGAARNEAAAIAGQALLAALKAREQYTAKHSEAVVGLATAVAEELGLDELEVIEVAQVALLHDIGKLGVPDPILHKPGALSEAEWRIMHAHPAMGEHVVASIPALSHLAVAVRAEHERWDGTGYPDGLARDAIPLASRICLVCDAWHASRRCCRSSPRRPAGSRAALHRSISRWEREQHRIRCLINVGDLQGRWKRFPVDEIYPLDIYPVAEPLLREGVPYVLDADDHQVPESDRNLLVHRRLVAAVLVSAHRRRATHSPPRSWPRWSARRPTSGWSGSRPRCTGWRE